MVIKLDALEFLKSDLGQSLLDQLRQEDLSPNNIFALVNQLRKTYTAEQVNAAITMAQLQQKAVVKFGQDAVKLFFTEDALQQASDSQIRQYRANAMAGKRVLDLCCGIGTDSIAFAQAGAIVDAVDYDELRIAIAKYNASQLNLKINFICADIREIDTQNYDIIFYDPARRDANGKRIYDVEQYIPPLSLINAFQAEKIIVKLSPGVDLDQLAPYQGAVEFMSVAGQLKEAVLEIPAKPQMIATRLDDSNVHQWIREEVVEDVPIAAPRGYLCEPDPAILRANLVQNIAKTISGTMLDSTIAYFCTAIKPDSAWLRAWKVREWMPFNLKKLRARLREMNVGHLTVKKRGSPITPEDLIQKLKLKGDKSVTLVLTKFEQQPIVIICDDIALN